MAKRLELKPSNSTYGMMVVLLLVIVVLVVIAVHIAKKFIDMLRAPGPSEEVFDELARAHRLNDAERKTLKRVARRGKLTPSARVFVEPRHLKACTGSNATCRSLFAKLFG